MESHQDTEKRTSAGPSADQERIRTIPELGQEVVDEDGISVTIPEGRIGELRCAFKAGCDCMGVIYARPDSNDVHVIGNCHDGTQTGDQANHRFTSGPWNLWVYNKTKARFEKILKKSVHLQDGKDSFILGATHRISATNKTCIVCIMDMVPEDQKIP